jgi:A/G-specific adenine glycosylase
LKHNGKNFVIISIFVLQTYEKMSISSTFINWYLQKKRNLPWRHTQNPYEIWVSEVILQQTRVAQGIGYYHRFLNSFPTLESLANADLEDVLKVWQGLGYYSRARNLHEGARYVLQQYSGILPASFFELLKIKGIGEYSASAIASFAYNLPYAVVDGNVSRVISRIYGVYDPVNSTVGMKSIRDIASQILDTERPGINNQAIMEFGAIQCTVKNPDCAVCPLNNECHAFARGAVDTLPIKIKKQKVRNRYFHYLILSFEDAIIMQKRTEKDIWEGLYEFPLIETDEPATIEMLSGHATWLTFFQNSSVNITHQSNGYKHLLSHQKINATFIHITSETYPSGLSNQSLLVQKKDIEKYPIPKLIENYLTEIQLI